MGSKFVDLSLHKLVEVPDWTRNGTDRLPMDLSLDSVLLGLDMILDILEIDLLFEEHVARPQILDILRTDFLQVFYSHWQVQDKLANVFHAK